MSSVLVQEIHKVEKPVYFISKVLKGAKARYMKIEKLAITVLVAARKLIPHFQGYKILAENHLPYLSTFEGTQFSVEDDIMGGGALTIRHLIRLEGKHQITSFGKICSRIHLVCGRGRTFILGTIYRRGLQRKRKWIRNSLGRTRQHSH